VLRRFLRVRRRFPPTAGAAGTGTAGAGAGTTGAGAGTTGAGAGTAGAGAGTAGAGAAGSVGSTTLEISGKAGIISTSSTTTGTFRRFLRVLLAWLTGVLFVAGASSCSVLGTGVFVAGASSFCSVLGVLGALGAGSSTIAFGETSSSPMCLSFSLFQLLTEKKLPISIYSVD